jgi:hypothetical protein
MFAVLRIYVYGTINLCSRYYEHKKVKGGNNGGNSGGGDDDAPNEN